jgi:hypothetical protein
LALAPNINNLEDSKNDVLIKNRFSGIPKYKKAGNKLTVANNVCPAISKPQVFDKKSWPWPPTLSI